METYKNIIAKENISLGLDNEIQNNVSVYWTCPEKYKVGGIQSQINQSNAICSAWVSYLGNDTRRLPFGGVRREELAIIG